MLQFTEQPVWSLMLMAHAFLSPPVPLSCLSSWCPTASPLICRALLSRAFFSEKLLKRCWQAKPLQGIRTEPELCIPFQVHVMLGKNWFCCSCCCYSQISEWCYWLNHSAILHEYLLHALLQPLLHALLHALSR